MKSILQVFSFDFLAKILVFGVTILIIRFMPEVEYAHYTLAISIVAVVTQTLASSFNRIYIVSCQKSKLVNSPSSFLGFQLYLISALVLISVPFNGLIDGIYWFVVSLIFATCLSEFAKTIFQSNLNFFHLSMVELNRNIIFAFSIIVLTYFVSYELQAGQVLLLQAAAMLVVFFGAFGKELDLKRMFKVKESVHLAIEMLKGEYKYIFGYFLVLGVFSQIDVFVLKAFSIDVELATYGSAFRYYSVLLLALGAVHTVLLPIIQNVKSLSELERILNQHKRMVLIFIPIVLLSAWVAQWIIPWVDMGKYPNAPMVFNVLAVSAIISFAFSPHANIVMRFEDFRFLFILISFALLGNVGFTILLVPSLGAIGAAIATMIAFGVVNGLTFWRSRKYRKLLVALPQENS